MSETIPPELPALPALQAGDPQALTALVDRFSPHIYRLALRMLGDAQDAEDVLQETFLKAIRALPAFEGRSSLSTWLYRIAVNEALMLIRKRRAATGISLDADDGDDEDALPLQIRDWRALPEEELTSAEARRALDQAVQKLPESLRVVFVLRDVEGLSIRETAETLNLSEGNVKVRLFRARLHLREALTEYFAERLSERSSE